MTNERFSKLEKDINEQKKLMSQIALNTRAIFNIPQASDFSGLSKSYLYKLIQKNKIKNSRPSGKMVFIKREDLIEFLCSGEQKTEKNYIDQIEDHLTKNK